MSAEPITQGLTEAQATAIFENIVNFAEYGFNKSHTTAYAMIGYQTAYLKTHYTAEFMAALLSSEIDDGNKRDIMVEHIADARKLGVDVEAPDINKGQPDFDVVNGKIVFGLTAIKGLGRGAAEEIVRVREKGGPYRDLFDFCERVDTRNVKQAQIEKLVKAGALDCFGKNKRNAMHLSVGRAMQSADGKADDRRRGQKNMFDMFGEDDDGQDEQRPGALPMGESLPDVAEWPELDRLKFEKEVLDFYMSSHPLAQFEDQLRRYRTHQAGQIGKLRAGTEVRMAGMITELLPKVVGKGRNSGNRWAIVRLEDFSGSAKCILWSDQFARFGDDVKLDSILLIDGKLESRDSAAEPDIIVDRVMTLETAKSELTRGMIVRMSYSEDAESTFDAIATILKRARGNCPVYLAVFDPVGKAARFKLNAEYFVNPMQVAVDQLEMLLGTGSVIFSGQA